MHSECGLLFGAYLDGNPVVALECAPFRACRDSLPASIGLISEDIQVLRSTRGHADPKVACPGNWFRPPAPDL